MDIETARVVRKLFLDFSSKDFRGIDEFGSFRIEFNVLLEKEKGKKGERRWKKGKEIIRNKEAETF